MSFEDWFQETKERYQDNSFTDATKESLYEFYLGGLRKISPIFSYGSPVWEDEWDVLVIMDACRDDVFREEYQNESWYTKLDSRFSVGSTSHEWMNKTFTDEFSGEMEDTIYVSGNPFTEEHIDKDEFMHVEEVWEYAWNSELGTILPEPLTEAAVALQQEMNPGRLIIHYMQPHNPFVNYPLSHMDLESFGEDHRSELDMLREGEMEKEEVWMRYKDNLQFLIDELQTDLFGSIEGKIALSADHGEMFGEYWLYGHNSYIPFPEVKKVPWVTLHSEKESPVEYSIKKVREKYGTQQKTDDEQVSQSTEDRLEDLGYL